MWSLRLFGGCGGLRGCQIPVALLLPLSMQVYRAIALLFCTRSHQDKLSLVNVSPALVRHSPGLTKGLEPLVDILIKFSSESTTTRSHQDKWSLVKDWWSLTDLELEQHSDSTLDYQLSPPILCIYSCASTFTSLCVTWLTLHCNSYAHLRRPTSYQPVSGGPSTTFFLPIPRSFISTPATMQPWLFVCDAYSIHTCTPIELNVSVMWNLFPGLQAI